MEESARSDDENHLVRCLNCNTVYSRPAFDQDAGPCPNCGYVGWIALKAGKRCAEGES